MPCIDYEPSREHDRLRDVLDSTTRMACKAFRALENAELLHTVDRKARQWWEMHKKRDALRLAKEKEDREHRALRATAIRKLSLAERRALGVKNTKE